MRVGLLAAVMAVLVPVEAAAEWHLKPFLGLSFGGGTTFVDVEDAAGGPHLVLGGNGTWLGEVVGVDVDFSHAPGYFQAGDRRLVRQSSVTTLSGSVVLAMPRRLNEYGLRPYLVGGLGLMRVRIDHQLDLLTVADTLPAMNLGGGATGFFTEQIGVSWELRYFRSIRQTSTGEGVSFGPEELSFWRGTMALAIRY